MNIEVRTDNHIEGTARMIEYVRDQLKSEFSRYSERVTHIEVHFSDENAEKGGDQDKRCAIEARAAGFKPMAVTNKASSVDLALDGAIEKLHHMFEHSLDKLNEHRHETRPNWEELVPEEE
jgi:ribosomal subunit interface protein